MGRLFIDITQKIEKVRELYSLKISKKGQPVVRTELIEYIARFFAWNALYDFLLEAGIEIGKHTRLAFGGKSFKGPDSCFNGNGRKYLRHFRRMHLVLILCQPE